MTITVGFLVFPGIQLLDLAGPYEIFSALPDGDIHGDLEKPVSPKF